MPHITTCRPDLRALLDDRKAVAERMKRQGKIMRYVFHGVNGTYNIVSEGDLRAAALKLNPPWDNFKDSGQRHGRSGK